MTPGLEAVDDPDEVALEAGEIQEAAVMESGDNLGANLDAAVLENGENYDIGKFACLPCGIAFR